MKKLLLIVMASYGLTAGAQVRPSRNFIYLYSDSVIYAQSIRLRADFNNYLQLRADSRRVPIDQVKFFNNEDGFYANTRKLNFVGVTSFAERIVEGKINLFQEVAYDPYLYDYGYRFRERRNETISLSMYYNKGNNDLKKVNYYNLKNDMSDQPESLQMLESYHKSIKSSTILYTAAGASVVAGLVAFLVTGTKNHKLPERNGFNGKIDSFGPKHPNFVASFALLGLGSGFAIGGFYVSRTGRRHLENAVDTYNR